MTDKERSKEIKAVVERIRHQDINWLIKQAERVQELEEKNIQLEKDIKEWGIVNECWEEINTRLIEQNKHYREANEIANKVLEGEDEE